MGDDPRRGRPRVVGRGGELVLGCQAVVDRDHAGAGGGGELPAEHVVGVHIADHPPAAVKEEVRRHSRPVGDAGRPVDPQRDRAVRSLRGDVLHATNLGRCGRGGRARVDEKLARILGRERVVGGTIRLGHQLEHGRYLRIESHRDLLQTSAPPGFVATRPKR